MREMTITGNWSNSNSDAVSLWIVCFWCRLTRADLDKWPLNKSVAVSIYKPMTIKFPACRHYPVCSLCPHRKQTEVVLGCIHSGCSMCNETQSSLNVCWPCNVDTLQCVYGTVVWMTLAAILDIGVCDIVHHMTTMPSFATLQLATIAAIIYQLYHFNQFRYSKMVTTLAAQLVKWSHTELHKCLTIKVAWDLIHICTG